MHTPHMNCRKEYHPDIQPVQAPFNGQAFLTKNLTPTILKSSLPLQKYIPTKQLS